MSVDDLGDLFDVDVLPARFTPHAPEPLVLTARRPARAAEVSRRHARALLALVQTRAAVLVRGLYVGGATDFARFGASVFDRHPPYPTQEHPGIEGVDFVYRPVRYAPDEKLLWHHEDTFNARWPRFVMFASIHPAPEGGETPLVDGRLVHAAASAALREPLELHGIRYVRHCDGQTGRTWQQLFGTRDPREALARAADRGQELDFTPRGAHIISTRAAFREVAHGTSWFNQLLHWHEHALPAELRELARAGLVRAPRACQIGDGTPIEPGLVDELIEAHRALEYPVAWKSGDILLIDNEIVAHGRNPYRNPREHLVHLAGGSGPAASALEPVPPA